MMRKNEWKVVFLISVNGWGQLTELYPIFNKLSPFYFGCMGLIL